MASHPLLHNVSRPRRPDTMEPRICAFENCEASTTKQWEKFPLCDRHVFEICCTVSRTAHFVERLFFPPLPKRPVPVNPKRHPAIVYFLRFGDRIKIGTTTNLLSRLEAVPHDEVLATRPGGHKAEHAEHRRWTHLRITGEWFKAEPELLEYIEQVRNED